MSEDAETEGRGDAEIRWLGDVQRLTVGPDDVIVLLTDEHLPDYAIAQIKLKMEMVLPASRILILSGGLRLGMIHEEREYEELPECTCGLGSATHSSLHATDCAMVGGETDE